MSADDKESPNKESNGSDTSISDNRVEQSVKVEQAIQEKELTKKKLHIAWAQNHNASIVAYSEKVLQDSNNVVSSKEVKWRDKF